MGADKGYARVGVKPRAGEELQAEARLPQAALHGHVRPGMKHETNQYSILSYKDNVARSKCDKCIGRSVIMRILCLC